MNGARIHPGLALRQGWRGLQLQPRLTWGFCTLACGLHLLGWALFAAGHGIGSAVLALLLNGVGVGLYAASLIWLIEGLSRLALAHGVGRRLRWRQLARWHGRQSWRLTLGLLNTALAAAAAALAGFMAWSLALLLLPMLSVLPALLGMAAVAAVLLSQLFNPCLVLDQRLSPSQAFGRGVDLLSRHWPALLTLVPLLLAILAMPFGLGLLAEGLGSGLGVVVTVLAMVGVLPVLAATISAAYRQLQG
ncbi:MAG: hypothetical protein RLZZ423_1494 [Cyanobacteriota bacterium]